MKRRIEAGQTIWIVAFGIFTFFAAAGLAVDMGYLRYEKRLMQSAADSAALAAATDANLGQAGTLATTDALAVTQANGFQNGVNNVTVTVNSPYTSVNPPNAVQVIVQKIFPTFFMQALGTTSATIAVAGVATIGTSEGCVYALQVGGAGLTVNGGIDSPNCGILDNGPLVGPGNLTAASIGVLGANALGGVATSAPVDIIAQPAANPMAYLAPPTPAACPGLPNPLVTAGVVAVLPGTYCNGITITGGTANFASGLYILSGGSLTISNAGTANGTGVTFYITNGATVSFTASSGSITLSSPTAAEIAISTTFQNLPPGILFYQDSTIAADVSDDGNGGTVVLDGTLYFPNAALTIAGSLNPNANTPIVAQSITVNGTVVMNADSTAVRGGSPMQNVSLVE
jgi:hypothetical protein